jgi:hypothetical protein
MSDLKFLVSLLLFFVLLSAPVWGADYPNFTSNGMMHIVKIRGAGIDTKLEVEDGKYSSFSVGNKLPLGFVAKTNSPNGVAYIFPVHKRVNVIDEKEQAEFDVLDPLTGDEVPFEMARAGVTAIKIINSVPVDQWRADKKAQAVKGS